MVGTVNVAPVAPTCMKVFNFAGAKQDLVHLLMGEGYGYCLRFGLVGGVSPTVGNISLEYRVMGVWLFFKEQFPLEQLPKRLQRKTPAVIGKKFYCHMTGFGSRAYFGRLTRKQVVEFTTFFRVEPYLWSFTQEEGFDKLRYARW